VIPNFCVECSKRRYLTSSTLPIFEPKYTSIVFDLAAASSEEFRVAKWLSVVRLQIVEEKGFVAAIEKLANVDRPGVFAVGPATLQICGTIDVTIVRTSESEVVAQGRFES
jgi:hypothetical protein